ncbi:MAG: penicillin-binding transpeptidase domain-containing protein, partial [Candidatus Limnocylindrales bacterium]
DWHPSVYFTGLQAQDAVRLFPLNPRRGDILDRKGRPLATTGFEETIGVVPGALSKGGKEAQALQAIGQDLHETPAQLQKKFANQPASWFIPLGVVPSSMDKQLHQQLDPIPGVVLRRKPIRIYPQGTVASHIVGYVGPVTKQELKTLAAQGYTTDDVVGQAGVEKWANAYLAGRKGGILAVVGRSGQVIQIIARRNVVEGDNVVLTIDLNIQKKAEQILNKLDGSAIVLNPQDNSVLALASYPSYNPNNFITGWSPQAWKKFSTSKNQPFLDRPVQLSFPTGSIFKVVTMSAAMETLGTKTTRVFDCNYWWHGPGMTLHNWRIEGHLNLIQSLTGSCDPTFYELGYELWQKNPSILSKFAGEFGFGKKTQINGVNNEIPGLVPSPAWKEKVYHQPWYAGDSVELAIGQSYLQATPIQVANAYSALADNGIRRSPLMVEKIVDQQGHVVKTFHAKTLGRLPDTPAMLATIKAGMLGTTSTPLGTAYYAFSTYKHPMEVKTGSASNQGKLAHAWFVGYSPPDHPQYLILVMIEGRGESMQIASPMARNLMNFLWPNSSPQPRPW